MYYIEHNTTQRCGNCISFLPPVTRLRGPVRYCESQLLDNLLFARSVAGNGEEGVQSPPAAQTKGWQNGRQLKFFKLINLIFGRGVGLTPAPLSSAEVLERVDLYLYSP